jgi:hypothetical protein
MTRVKSRITPGKESASPTELGPVRHVHTLAIEGLTHTTSLTRITKAVSRIHAPGKPVRLRRALNLDPRKSGMIGFQCGSGSNELLPHLAAPELDT